MGSTARARAGNAGNAARLPSAEEQENRQADERKEWRGRFWKAAVKQPKKKPTRKDPMPILLGIRTDEDVPPRYGITNYPLSCIRTTVRQHARSADCTRGDSLDMAKSGKSSRL